jgi:hypothetical protein
MSGELMYKHFYFFPLKRSHSLEARIAYTLSRQQTNIMLFKQFFAHTPCVLGLKTACCTLLLEVGQLSSAPRLSAVLLWWGRLAHQHTALPKYFFGYLKVPSYETEYGHA